MPAAAQPGALELEPVSDVANDVAAPTTGKLAMEESAFRQFYEQIAPRLFAYLLRVSGERSLAEDLLQEAFCRFLGTEHHGMNFEQGQRYLFRIATNLLRDRWRRHREHVPVDDLPDHAGAAPHLDHQLEMRQAFLRLKLRERQMLWLAYVEGLNHNEIAQMIGVRPASVRLLLFRARRRLVSLIRSGKFADGEVSQ